MTSKPDQPPRRPASSLDLGPLPIEKINAVLGTELEAGNARASREAHRHMAVDHSADYPICKPALLLVIASPTFIGQDPKHANNFVLVKRIGLPDGRSLLVAIGLEPRGNTYSVRTSYLISEQDVSSRRAAGRLRTPPPPKWKKARTLLPGLRCSHRSANSDLLASLSSPAPRTIELVSYLADQVRGVAVPTSASTTYIAHILCSFNRVLHGSFHGPAGLTF